MLQLNDAIAEIKDVYAFVLTERAARHEDERKLIWTSLKADNTAEMYLSVKSLLSYVELVQWDIKFHTLQKKEVNK